MKYKNPILSGFYPDPSICRVGNDYYLVTSSFEYYPSIPIFHSVDLINWTQIGHVITDDNQMHLKQGAPNRTGMYAPTIRYHNETFYVICTNVTYGEKDEGNFFVYSKYPDKDWSQPIFLDTPGIDPSLFFDDDGKVYYTGTHNNVYMYEIDIKTGHLLSERIDLWEGTGGSYPESPHLYKFGDYYYLLIAEGGTELGHMITVARSKSIQGPYQSNPNNPILSNRSVDLPIKAVGHGDIVEDQKGNFWAVCLGIRTLSYPFLHNLGRETSIVPVTWKDDWPVFGENKVLEEEIETDLLPVNTVQKRLKEYSICFSKEQLDYEWNTIYSKNASLIYQEEAGLVLSGNQNALHDSSNLAWIGVRQKHHAFKASTKLFYSPKKNAEEAGLTIYLNNLHHYEIAYTKINNEPCLILRRQIGTLMNIEACVSYKRDSVEFILEGNKETYSFSYLDEDKKVLLGEGEVKYLTTEVGGAFTGNYIGLYATGNGKSSSTKAVFERFNYKAVDVK